MTSSNQLFTAAYGELRRLAHGMVRHRERGHTLQATALVHETFLKLVSGATIQFESRGHFFGVAAKVMRQILVDRIRRRMAVKHGSGAEQLELKEEIAGMHSSTAGLLEINQALEALAAIDPRRAKVLEMTGELGLTGEEVAVELNISEATVRRDLRMGRAWVAAYLCGNGKEHA